MVKKTLCITTTSCIRPNILEKTYTSFLKYCKDIENYDIKLKINIDPLPKKAKPKHNIKICKKIFTNVEYRIADQANFTTALKWCWSNIESNILFHLEDDWAFIRPFYIRKMIKYLEKKRVIKGLRKKCIGACLRVYPLDDKICLTPSIVDIKWANEISQTLDETLNPERQIRKKYSKTHFYEHLPRKNKKQIFAKDIGRAWLSKTKYKRELGATFVSWSRK